MLTRNEQVILHSTLNKGEGGAALQVFVTDCRLITLITVVFEDVSLTNFTLAVYEDIASLNVTIFSLSRNFAPV